MTTQNNMNCGVSLTGGGARGSYQAGVLKALIEILKEQDMLGANCPFKYWAGVSAGSINSAFLSAGAHELDQSAERLVELWSNITPEQVYLTDIASLGRNSVRWIRDLTFGSVFKTKLARSLLDTEPLWDLIGDNVDLANIQKNIDSGLIKGSAISAYSYYDNRTVTFLQSNEEAKWDRHRRYSKKTELKTEHIVASCSIPLLFPSVKIGEEHFADGGFRNLSPISPMLHMGAQKILVISVRGKHEFSESIYKPEPGIARIAGVILNALFFDTIDIDLERVRHINELIAAKGEIETNRSSYSKIEYHVVRPSIDVSRLAVQKAKSFPKLIDFFMGGLGPIEESAELASYILFVSDFTKDLIEVGYNDMMKQKASFVRWLEAPAN